MDLIGLVKEALMSLVDEIECLLRSIDEKEHCVAIYTIDPRQCLHDLDFSLEPYRTDGLSTLP
jgi:hypothetical protein